MKSLIYQFRRARLASTLNLLGIALTLAGTFVLLTQVMYHSRYNHCFPGYNDVYRVEAKGVFAPGEWGATLSRPMAERIAQMPIVEKSTCVWMAGDWIFDKDGSDIACPVVQGDGQMLTLLGAQCVDGTLELGEKDGDKLVIQIGRAHV